MFTKEQRILLKLKSLEGFTSVYEFARTSELTKEQVVDRFLKRINEDVLEIIDFIEGNKEK